MKSEMSLYSMNASTVNLTAALKTPRLSSSLTAVRSVYFRPDNKLVHADHGEHAGIISDICMDYFRDFDRMNADYLKKFIRDNFEIRSDCSTIEKISEDAPFIAELIELR